MPLFYQNVSDLLSLGSKYEIDVFPWLGSSWYCNSMILYRDFMDYSNKYLKTKESKDCHEAFMRSVWDVHSHLKHRLLKQNAEMPEYFDFDYLDSRKTLQQDRIRDLIFMTGVVQNKSEIERVIDSADFKYFFEKVDLESEAKFLHDLRWETYCYSRHKDTDKKSCLKCSGGPCLFKGDSVANDVNIGDGCMMYRGVVDKISVDMSERVQIHKSDFDSSHLQFYGCMDRSTIRGEILTSECSFSLSEVAEMKLTESVHEMLSQFRWRGKRWIQAELEKLTPTPRVIRKPTPLAQLASIFGRTLLMDGFLAFGRYRLIRNVRCMPRWYVRLLSPEWHRTGRSLKRRLEEEEGLWGMKEEKERRQQALRENAFNTLDLYAMFPHLDSIKARIAYTSLCDDIRTEFLKTHKVMPRYAEVPDPFLKFYYRHFYEHEPLRRPALKTVPSVKKLRTYCKTLDLFIGGCAFTGFLAGYKLQKLRRDGQCYP